MKIGEIMSPEQRGKLSKIRIERGISKGNKNPNWRGGRIKIGEYIYIYSPSHPNATKGGYVAEHRLMMEKHLGRVLLSTEVVHHINEIKDDNRIENLMLYSSTGQHTKENHIKRGKNGRFSK